MQERRTKRRNRKKKRKITYTLPNGVEIQEIYERNRQILDLLTKSPNGQYPTAKQLIEKLWGEKGLQNIQVSRRNLESRISKINKIMAEHGHILSVPVLKEGGRNEHQYVFTDSACKDALKEELTAAKYLQCPLPDGTTVSGLTIREKQLLEFLISSKNYSRSKGEIGRKIWPEEYESSDIFDQRIGKQLERLKSKLADHGTIISFKSQDNKDNSVYVFVPQGKEKPSRKKSFKVHKSEDINKGFYQLPNGEKIMGLDNKSHQILDKIINSHATSDEIIKYAWDMENQQSIDAKKNCLALKLKAIRKAIKGKGEIILISVPQDGKRPRHEYIFVDETTKKSVLETFSSNGYFEYKMPNGITIKDVTKREKDILDLIVSAKGGIRNNEIAKRTFGENYTSKENYGQSINATLKSLKRKIKGVGTISFYNGRCDNKKSSIYFFIEQGQEIPPREHFFPKIIKEKPPKRTTSKKEKASSKAKQREVDIPFTLNGIELFGLNRKDKDILERLITSNGHYPNSTELITAVWGEDATKDPKKYKVKLDTAIRHIKQSLGENGTVTAYRTPKKIRTCGSPECAYVLTYPGQEIPGKDSVFGIEKKAKPVKNTIEKKEVKVPKQPKIHKEKSHRTQDTTNTEKKHKKVKGQQDNKLQTPDAESFYYTLDDLAIVLGVDIKDIQTLKKETNRAIQVLGISPIELRGQKRKVFFSEEDHMRLVDYMRENIMNRKKREALKAIRKKPEPVELEVLARNHHQKSELYSKEAVVITDQIVITQIPTPLAVKSFDLSNKDYDKQKAKDDFHAKQAVSLREAVRQDFLRKTAAPFLINVSTGIDISLSKNAQEILYSCVPEPKKDNLALLLFGSPEANISKISNEEKRALVKSYVDDMIEKMKQMWANNYQPQNVREIAVFQAIKQAKNRGANREIMKQIIYRHFGYDKEEELVKQK